MFEFEIEPDDDDSGLSDLIGEGPVPFPTRTVRSFAPWHRPRKQYVRRVQWSKELNFLVRDLNMNDCELRYLTLPGNDFIDIRHLAETVCSLRGLKLKYLGFNTAANPKNEAQTEVNSSQFSVNRLDSIHRDSEVFPGDFRSVGEPRSVPWQRVREAGPFHAINLDLCGGFAGDSSSGNIPNYFAALTAVLQNQLSGDGKFLLFITTRIDDDSVDGSAGAKLTKLIQDIYDNCESYASEFRRAWEIPDTAESVVVGDSVAAPVSLMLGLTQWIINNSVRLGFRAKVRSFMTYRSGSGSGEDDLVSLAIRFEPDPVLLDDGQGFVKSVSNAQSSVRKICVQSSPVPWKVRQRSLVDQILAAKMEEYARCVEESAKLLSSAGYDPDAYRSWAASV